MKVIPTNNFYVCRYNNVNASNQNKNQYNPSFGYIEGLGEKVLRAGASELKELVELYHTLPEGAFKDLLEIRNSWGFVKKDSTIEAYGKFQRELGRLKGEIDMLKVIDNQAARNRLKALEEKGEIGRKEYYIFPSDFMYESQVDKDVRDTFNRGI